jgi:predicted amidophosphoribosyltransferase
MSIANQCPVCQARFRGARLCSRCGADLEALMVLSVKAWQSRQAARQALGAGEIGQALHHALRAQEFQQTPQGQSLRVLCEWLSRHPVS